MKDSVDMEDEEEGMVEEEEDEEEEEETVEITKVNGEDSLVMNASVLNGDDDDDEDEEHQLSIDTGEQDEVSRPTIRVAKGLVKDNIATLTNGTKRKAITTAVSLPVKKARPSVVDSEQEMKELEKEVKALQWLARRKEQEWDQVIRLLKQKEERLLRCQRNKVMALTEAEHLLSKLQPVVVPQQQVLLLSAQPRPQARHIAPKPPTTPKPPSAPGTPTIVLKTRASPTKTTPSPMVSPVKASPATPGPEDKAGGQGETKFSAVLEKASKNLAKATKGKDDEGKTVAGKKEKNTPACQGCGKRKSEFVCAGCSNRWYCSRECQVEDWDEHADDCSG